MSVLNLFIVKLLRFLSFKENDGRLFYPTFHASNKNLLIHKKNYFSLSVVYMVLLCFVCDPGD